MAITTLIENGKGEHLALKYEHGLSFLVEAGERKILFDTGQSGAFLDNARQLRLDMSAVSDVVLSHGHYDHTGGLTAFLSCSSPPVSIHVGEGFFIPKYARKGKSIVYLGNNFDRKELEEAGHRVIEYRDDTNEIYPGIYICRNFAREADPGWENPRFVVPHGEGYKIDDFSDEVVLVIKSNRGLVLVAGCSHPGVINILADLRRRFSEPVHAFIGGTHLVEASGSRLVHAVAAFEESPALLLGTSHCTGKTAMERLREVCPNYYPNHTGDSLIVG